MFECKHAETQGYLHSNILVQGLRVKVVGPENSVSVGEELTPSAATAGTTMAPMISRSCRQIGLPFMHQAHYTIFSLLQPPRRLQQCDGKVMCWMQIPQPVGRHMTDASPSSACLWFSSSLPCIVSYFFVTRCVLSGSRRAACVVVWRTFVGPRGSLLSSLFPW